MSAPDAGVASAAADRRRMAVLVVAGLLFLAPGLFYDLPGPKSVVGGLRILRGEVPYRDFWTMYAPGQFYLVAGLFLVFGAHHLVQGIAALALVAGTGAVLYRIARRIGGGATLATAVGAAYIAAQWTTHPTIDSYHPAMLLVLLGVDCVVAHLGGAPPRSLLLAGVAFGAGACFKHDVAFHVAAASCVAVTLGWALAGARRPAGWISPARAVARIAAGAAMVLVPVGSLLAASAGVHVWECLFVFPAVEFPLVMTQPYAGILPDGEPVSRWLASPRDVVLGARALDSVAQWTLLSLPQYVFLAGAAWLALRRRDLDPRAVATGILALAAIPLFWLAAHVQHNTHPMSMAVFSMLFGVLFHVAPGRPATTPAARRGLVAGFAVCVAALSAKPLILALDMAKSWREARPLDHPVADGVRVSRARFEQFDPVVRFVREHVPPDEPIYSGVARHDAIVINNQYLYYLADRPVAVRWNELHPALADSPGVQREIIASLEEKGVRCVILWHFGRPDAFFDEISAARRKKLPHLGSTLLDEYLEREYKVVATHGEYRVCWRRDAWPPTPWRDAAEELDSDISREDLRRRR